jgi:hypothetical protein
MSATGPSREAENVEGLSIQELVTSDSVFNAELAWWGQQLIRISGERI